MRRFSFEIPPGYDGRKVVHYLREAAGCSAALVKRLKQAPDGMLLNGMHIRTVDRLHTGDRLEITLHDEPKPAAVSMRDVPILYEDADVLVFDKPPGMPCHQSKRHQEDTLANTFAALCAARGEPMTFRAVNRLDRDTTGAVVVAKNAYAAAALGGNVEKVYLAAAGGALPQEEGRIDAPIGRPDPYNIRRAVMEGGREAVTLYRVLYRAENGNGPFTLAACRLPTGRTHQIRVHMAHIGCPLIGDSLYGARMDGLGRQALHCARAAFERPDGGGMVTVEALPPDDMRPFLPPAWGL